MLYYYLLAFGFIFIIISIIYLFNSTNLLLYTDAFFYLVQLVLLQGTSEWLELLYIDKRCIIIIIKQQYSRALSVCISTLDTFAVSSQRLFYSST